MARKLFRGLSERAFMLDLVSWRTSSSENIPVMENFPVGELPCWKTFVLGDFRVAKLLCWRTSGLENFHVRGTFFTKFAVYEISYSSI